MKRDVSKMTVNNLKPTAEGRGHFAESAVRPDGSMNAYFSHESGKLILCSFSVNVTVQLFLTPTDRKWLAETLDSVVKLEAYMD